MRGWLGGVIRGMKPALILSALLALPLLSKGAETAKPKLAWQYESGDIRVSLPSEDEPRVTEFGRETVAAAVKYLENGALAWVREKSCVNCHTTGPYLSERPGLQSQLGKPNEEIWADFVEFVPAKISAVKEAEKNGHRYYPSAFMSVWRSLGLAEWDKHITQKTSEATDRSLRDLFERQSESGAFVSHGEVEIPHITTDFELSLQAARAITTAPGWIEGVQDAGLKAKIAKLNAWLRAPVLKNDFDRVLRLQLAHYMPEMVGPGEVTVALTLLASKQHEDGGWSTRDFSPLKDWHFEISPNVANLINHLPDAADPQSDAYMTALAVVLMRQSDVPASDPRIQRAVAWLKREQRVSGRWWMHSLYRGNYHYITYIATMQALKALALCGEIPEIKEP
jgi:squalene-hopene/tetraprenyl-beta-curcumene cyclase